MWSESFFLLAEEVEADLIFKLILHLNRFHKYNKFDFSLKDQIQNCLQFSFVMYGEKPHFDIGSNFLLHVCGCTQFCKSFLIRRSHTRREATIPYGYMKPWLMTIHRSKHVSKVWKNNNNAAVICAQTHRNAKSVQAWNMKMAGFLIKAAYSRLKQAVGEILWAGHFCSSEKSPLYGRAGHMMTFSFSVQRVFAEVTSRTELFLFFFFFS